MTNKTYLFLAAICTSIADVASKFATEIPESTPEPAQAGGEQPENTDKPKRGRPAKTQTPVETETAVAKEPETPAAGGKDYSDQDLRDAAAKLIEDGRGAEVKKLIVKHSGSDKLATVPAANRAAFVRDIEALDL